MRTVSYAEQELADTADYSVCDCVLAVQGAYIDLPVNQPSYIEVLPAAVLYQIILTSNPANMLVNEDGGYSCLHAEELEWCYMAGGMPDNIFERSLAMLAECGIVVYDRRGSKGHEEVCIHLTELGRTGYPNGYAEVLREMSK